MRMPLSHPSHARADIKPITDELYVVTMLSNPLRWRSRYWNYWDFENHMNASGAALYTAEVAYSNREYEVTSASNPRNLQLRSSDEIWLKENALNLAIQRLPADAKYVAWIDADVKFARPDWVQETLHQLQHFDFVQMFSQSQDLGPDYTGMGNPAYSFGYCYREGLPRLKRPGPMKADDPLSYPYGGNYGKGVYWHPGFAWAARLESLDKVGGLIDWSILGSGDWFMANALIGDAEVSLWPNYHENFKNRVREWQGRAEKYVRRNLGYVPGLITHAYHGRKADRMYQKRYKILAEHLFNPDHDLWRDRQGLWQLNPENSKLRDLLRRINRLRREDG